MNNIPKFMVEGEYNYRSFQLVDYSLKCPRCIDRDLLQSEGVAHSIDLIHAQSMASSAIAKPSETFCFYGITTI